MRDIDILHDLLKKQCPQIHQKRLNSLMVATDSLLDGNQLSLTQLGRNITGNVAPKHNIKRIDRLLGNLHVIKDKFALINAIHNIYAAQIRYPLFLWIGLMYVSNCE